MKTEISCIACSAVNLYQTSSSLSPLHTLDCLEGRAFNTVPLVEKVQSVELFTVKSTAPEHSSLIGGVGGVLIQSVKLLSTPSGISSTEKTRIK